MARAGLTADRLTQAAADLADEVGLENVTVSALARHFGVKDASLYSHIRNAHDLRIRLAVLSLSELADLVSEAIGGRSGRDALVAFGLAYRGYASSHPGRYAATQLALDPDVAGESAGRYDDMVRAVLLGYGLWEPDLTDAARLVHSAFHGYVSLERSGAFHRHPRGVEASWLRSLDALDAVLRTWPTA
ncbi:transcriptional regulator, TetR family [Lentzea fradiae]|uniref:Transcriptional regulator, TetR family n=1 Tax=Lentzea fradiae TaxID=200378 RepID=A0A1G7WAZ0_9PSEU|nr:TetR/AcrR family transcriptional regulator [Lentzea fradiae]SDG68260.1 transcriptional regulator, TetR family [Lentzea fradiae]